MSQKSLFFLISWIVSLSHLLFGYTPVTTPNVGSLSYVMDGGVKVFHLVAEPIIREMAPGFFINCWGYNGSSPGPTIEAVEGDRVRILVTNHLKEPTTVHWHGVIVPNGMDGVGGLTQPAIQPGETFKYEFTLKQNGTFMYHSHSDDTIQLAMGMMGFFLIHPKEEEPFHIDHDFALFLHEWSIPIGARTPDPLEMVDFNVFTFNGVLYPKSEALVVKKGERVRVRLANVMMSSHPIHLHGHEFRVTSMGARSLPLWQQYTTSTVAVEPGETRDIEFIADNPGDWALHCHKPHHMMNQMNHDLSNLIGIEKEDLTQRIRHFFADFHSLMNTEGMGEMFSMFEEGHHERKITMPANIAPIGHPGPFGVVELGGMFTILKVREEEIAEGTPTWYGHPPGSLAEKIFTEQLEKEEKKQP